MKNLIVIVFINSIFVSLCFATQETALTVSQPIFANGKIYESKSTYIFMINYSIATKMSLTCAENCVKFRGENNNKNLANYLGFKIEFSRKWEDMYINYGDTVKVDLYISFVDFDTLPRYYNDISLEHAVAATITCLFNNALSYDHINYLDVNIIGNKEFDEYSKVYDRNNIFKLEQPL